jgi:hypothetical protein
MITNTDILLAADIKLESQRKTIRHLGLVSLYDAIAIDFMATLGVCTYVDFCKIPSMDLQRARRLTTKGFIKIQSKSGKASNNKPINHYILTDNGIDKAKEIDALCNRIREAIEKTKQI